MAKPLGLPFHKHKKKKIKHFDLSDDSPVDLTPEHVTEPKTPVNTTETPDLPAGVPTPPVQLPPEKTVIDDEPVKPKLKNQKPKELEELYGPDNNIKDDKVITSPSIPENKTKIPIQEPDLDLDLEQGISDIFDGVAEDEPIIEEQEEPEQEDVLEPDQSTQPVPNPPVHEFCHCEIKTMPGGRRIWRANEGACSDCLNARDTFNQWQQSLFGS